MIELLIILLDNELKKLKTRVNSSEKIKINDVQKEISFIRGFISYTQNSNLVYECKVSSMKFYISGIFEWKPKDIYDNSSKNLLYSVQNTKNITPNIILMVSYMFFSMVAILYKIL